MKYLLTRALSLLRSSSTSSDPQRPHEPRAQPLPERPEIRQEDGANHEPADRWLDCWVSGSAIR